MYHFLSVPSVPCKGQPSMSSDPWFILGTANWTLPYQSNQILPWGFKMEWIKIQTYLSVGIWVLLPVGYWE